MSPRVNPPQGRRIESADDRQSIRDQVLGTRAVDFARLAKALEQFADQGRVVVMGAPEALEVVGTERGDGFELIRVM